MSIFKRKKDKDDWDFWKPADSTPPADREAESGSPAAAVSDEATAPTTPGAPEAASPAPSGPEEIPVADQAAPGEGAADASPPEAAILALPPDAGIPAPPPADIGAPPVADVPEAAPADAGATQASEPGPDSPAAEIAPTWETVEWVETAALPATQAEAPVGTQPGAEARAESRAERAEGRGRGRRHAAPGRGLVLAVTFLTGLPLRASEATPDELWSSMAWYPLVGLGLGVAGWCVYALMGDIAPAGVAAAVTVVALEAFTRVLHLDGLMDTCDGYFSGAPRERALEIMKDSRTGAMGVFGAVAVMLLKVTALASLSRSGAVVPLLVGWTAARALPPIDVRWFPYARDEGTGKAFNRGRGDNPPIVALALLVIVAAATGGATGRLGAVVVVVVVSLVLALLAQLAVARRLGGLTGDVYGFGVELVETVALVVAAALA